MITSHLEQVIGGEQGKDVVLVLHSFGGVPGCAAAGTFLRFMRKDQGKEGGIVAVLFLATFASSKGMSYLQAFGGKHAPFVMMEVRVLHTWKWPSHCLHGRDRVQYVTSQIPSMSSTTTFHLSMPTSTCLNWCRKRWHVLNRSSLMTASMALCRVLICSVRVTIASPLLCRN